VHPRDIEDWESGEYSEPPWRGVLSKLAEAYRRPSLYFFLSKVPDPPPFPRDFRTVDGREPVMSPEVLLAWRRARRIQEYVSELLQDRAFELPVAARADDPEAVGGRERKRLGVTETAQRSWRSPNEAFNSWRRAIQGAGVLVFAMDIKREHCRGFALYDPELRPAIVVTTKEIDQAKTFTLAHEYGHLLLRMSAACLREESAESEEGRVERWCNQFAAALLVPRSLLDDVTRPIDLAEVNRLARRLTVSRHVVAIRLEELALVERGFYKGLQAMLEAEEMRKPDAQAQQHGGGRSAVQRKITELGAAALTPVLAAWDQGDVSTLEAARMLDTPAERLQELARAIVVKQ
jgi:Zn-dependent peptidase ImmA (M78 family)